MALTADQLKKISSPGLAGNIAPSQIGSSVADKVADYTSKDSELMKMARTEGKKVANRRGLGNSSIATGAMMDAMLKQAVPIASQDAAQDHERDMQVRDFEFGMVSQDDQQSFAQQQAERDKDIEAYLMQTGSDLRIDEMTEAQKNEIASLKEQGNQTRKNMSKQKDMDMRLQNDQQKFQKDQAELDRELQQSQLSQNELKNATDFIAQIESSYQQAVNSIMSSNFPHSKKMARLKAAAQNRDNQLKMARELYSQLNIKWPNTKA